MPVNRQVQLREEQMIRNIAVVIFCVVMVMAVSCQKGADDAPKGEVHEEKAVKAARTACDLITRAEVEKATGITVNNVVLKDRSVFTSCSFEAENWEDTIGVIYYPGLKPAESSAALAADIKGDLERDQAPYGTPEPIEGIGDAAAYYVSHDGQLHTIVAQRGGDRVIIGAKSRAAVTEMVKAALASK